MSKKSWVWGHFASPVQTNDGKETMKTECNHCHKMLCYVDHSTSNLSSHLKNKHNLQPPKTNPTTNAILSNVEKESINQALVEGEGFEEFCKKLNPNYKVQNLDKP